MGLLYTKMKVFHFMDKIRSLPAEVGTILPPIHIRIKPTNTCNQNCQYCSYRAGNLQLGKDMDVRASIPRVKMMEILDDIIEMGVKAVTFSGGGEPFVYPHLLEAAMKLAESGVKFASLTNGSRLNGELAEVFARHATWLRVSLDGWDGESYSRYRGVPATAFEKLMGNLDQFVKLRGKCYLGISLIVGRENSGHIYDLTCRLKDIGVNSVKVSPCVVSDDSDEQYRYHACIAGLVRSEMEKTRKLSGSGFEVFDSYHADLISFEKSYSWCPYLQILPVIGADLNVYPCQDKAYNLDTGVVGTIKDKRFREFWFADKGKFFGIKPSEHCVHHCVAHDKNRMILEFLGADAEHLGFV